MKIVCLIVERKLAWMAARGVEAGSGPIVAHLRRCSACRQTLADLNAIRTELETALPCRQASPDCASRISDRIGAAAGASAPRAGLSEVLFGAAMGVAIIAIAVFATSSAWRAPRHSHTEKVAERTLHPQTNKPTEDHGFKHKESPRTHVHTALPTPAKHRKHIRHDGTPLPAPARTYLADRGTKHDGQKLSWATVGLYYEYLGDYRQASAAYALAYKQKPGPALAYATARSAESAGDIDRALDYYASVLDASPAPNH